MKDRFAERLSAVDHQVPNPVEYPGDFGFAGESLHDGIQGGGMGAGSDLLDPGEQALAARRIHEGELHRGRATVYGQGSHVQGILTRVIAPCPGGPMPLRRSGAHDSRVSVSKPTPRLGPRPDPRRAGAVSPQGRARRRFSS